MKQRIRNSLVLTALGALALGACAPTLRSDGAIAVQFDPSSYRSAIEAMASYADESRFSGLRPGDLVRVSVVQVPDLETETRVLPNGEISLAYIGAVEVTGKSIGTVQNEIQNKLSRYVVDPVVTVSVTAFADALPKPKIYLIGNVRNPGAYAYDEPLTVLEALALSGGTELGSDLNAIVTIRREGEAFIATIHRAGDILHRGAADGTLSYLMPRDVVYVPRSNLTRTADIMDEVRRVIGFNGVSANVSFRYDDED